MISINHNSRDPMPKNTQLLDHDAFTALVAKATRKAGIPVERSEGLALFITHQGQSMRCNLTTAYQAYRQSPDRLDDVVQAHLAALATLPATSLLPTAADLSTELMPLLNQSGRLQSLQSAELPAPYHRPFPGGLVVTYVVDQPQHMAYVNPRLYESLGAAAPTEEELYQVAVNNLRKRTRPKGYEIHGFGDRMMIVHKELDGYTACRILLPELLDEWARKMPGRLLLGIPNRDFLIAFSDKDPQQVASVARQVRTDAAKMPRPLSNHVLVWHEGRLREHQLLH